MVLSYDPLVARMCAGRSSYALTHVSAYGPEFSRQRDNIVTNDLSNCVHMKDGKPGAHTIDAYMREGVTN